MFDRTPGHQPVGPLRNPLPLVVAAALVAVQGVVLVGLAVAEALHVVGDRVEVGLGTAVFFLLYGAALVACAVALTRRQGWARGPVLLTQLIELGIAWNVRDEPVVAVALALAAAVTLAGMLHPDSIRVLLGADDPEDPDDG